MDKSPEAFRTISEVATLLETPAHVLRFWESRFPQIRPVKRAGGRRYYRPNDVALLTGIKYLLHAEGMTIRGVQKVLRDQGVRHVAALIGGEIVDVDEDAEAALNAALSANFGIEVMPEDIPAERAESATIVALETALRRKDRKARQEQHSEPVDTIDFTQEIVETPILPGLDFALQNPAKPAAFDGAQSAIAAMHALPHGCLAGVPDAATILSRARALHSLMVRNAGQFGA
jgi:DNA-binding transcriptional MerR regulator